MKEYSSQERLDICKKCDLFQKDTGLCKKCLCVMKLKTKLKNAKCPIGKWN